ncbi:MAG: VCBS repeat-containing protein [Mucilaginibacter sp.]
MLKFYPILFVLFFISIFSCKKPQPLFKQVDSEYSGIHFKNTIIETDSINVLDFENVYNGSGVGVGDFNNDGLQDVFFAGNMVSNKLYINKGKLKFKDITNEAGVTGDGRWCRGVTVIDINNDGWQDIYVCTSTKKNPEQRQNLLYINQGLDKNGNPVFKEMAKEYGLNDTTYSTMATFFDYDNDGDLDVYIAVNQIIPNDYPNRFRPRLLKGEHPSTGRLYRNDWDDKLKHPVFTNVSKQAGITIEGYGHHATATDINQDGWKDILVSNDYLSNDILYINNRDGTFTDKSTTYFKHTSANGMGNDVADINNDGLPDVVEMDMRPQDNYRKKMMSNASSYQTYQNIDHFNYQYQYVRNTLQLNQGPRVNQNDSIGDPVFSDISFFAGVAESDWSWTPMVTDFDNDGYRDIIITNGFPKDVTDHDFVAYRQMAFSLTTKKELLKQIPEVKINKYAFHNSGDLTFKDVSKDWGFTTPTFSNGAAYADFDNDGDIDIIISNINDEASVYENTLMDDKKSDEHHYLSVKLTGSPLNRDGLGTWIDLYYQGKHQVYEENPYRGYLSSIQKEPHFGLGNIKKVDSVVVRWPNGKKQVIRNVRADQMLKVNIANADQTYTWDRLAFAKKALFKDITDSVGIHYKHKAEDFIDFNIQKLLPHKFSEYAPALAVGDVDGNGLDDIIIGGSSLHPAQLLLQQKNGKFIQKSLIPGFVEKDTPDISTIIASAQKGSPVSSSKDEGILLFDADGDGDLDLYISSGGYEFAPNTSSYQDRLYINDGKGNFTLAKDALPQNFTSKLCVRAIDYNRDGKLDLFVSGRVDPWRYPNAVSSFIFRNDSKNGRIKFTDVTNEVAPSLKNIGLVCDALFTDFNNDGWPDLILAGEWMPITFLQNNKGIFQNVTGNTGISDKLGWWNTITAGDFDKDGKTDYIIGNLGLNSFYKASDKYPVYITANDFFKNGGYDAIPSLFLLDVNGEMQEFPAHTRDDIVKQMIGMRTRFQNYRSYALAPMDSILTPEQRKGALRLKANTMSSVYLHNMGNGKFTMSVLPSQAQFSVLNGMTVDDFDGDGNLDVIINGNDYGTDVSVGRYDALNGLMLKGDGKGNFKPQTILQSGIYIPGNGKALVKLVGAKGNYLLAASQNKDVLKIFELNGPKHTVKLQDKDSYAIIKYKDGKTAKEEFYYGTSFLSQSGRFFTIDKTMESIKVTDIFGHVRNIPLN